MGKIILSVSKITDSRKQTGNFRHKLSDVLILALFATLAGIQDFIGMEMFGQKKQKLFRKFLELPNGVPDESTFRRVLAKINP